MDHKSFIHSPVDLHLSFSHFFTIINIVAINTHVRVFVRTFFVTSLGYTPGTETPGHMVTACITF